MKLNKYGKIAGAVIVTAIMVIAAIVATQSATAAGGNGIPENGNHYNLNLIGVQKEKNVDPTWQGSNGHRIFVPLTGKCTIWLNKTPAETFSVYDYDGTDGAATLGLPDPYEGIYTGQAANYRIYVRELGKPGGKASITAGYYDQTDNTWWYSLDVVTLERKKGQSVFVDRTLSLTTIQADFDGDGDLERMGLFDEGLEGYFWDYDNNGLKLAQLRFYY